MPPEKPEMTVDKQRWTLNMGIIAGLLTIALTILGLIVYVYMRKGTVPTDLAVILSSVVSGLLGFLNHPLTAGNPGATLNAPNAQNLNVTQQPAAGSELQQDPNPSVTENGVRDGT